MLTQNCRLAGPHFPPPAIVEVLQKYVTNHHKVRRLHLIVLDLWGYNTSRRKRLQSNNRGMSRMVIILVE